MFQAPAKRSTPEPTENRSAEPLDYLKPPADSPGPVLRNDIPEPVFPTASVVGTVPDAAVFQNPSVTPLPAVPARPDSARDAAASVAGTLETRERTGADEQSGPSEYTRAVAIHVRRPDSLKNPDLPPAPVAVPSPPQPAAEKVGRPSYLPLILIMNALFLAALSLILYFILKK